MSTGIVQLRHEEQGRRVARVEGGHLQLLEGPETAYGWVREALAGGPTLLARVQSAAVAATISYEEVWEGASEWRLLPAMDHPREAGCCHVTGTGLTHRASADNRAAMHTAGEALSDSMKMYQWGLEGGRPAAGTIGVSPEWFYKGNGTILRAHNESLEVPGFAEDGGEEAEIAGIYVVDDEGTPRRVGLAQGNEFSDHVFEKWNYLYLASSKLRQCAIGPELILDPHFEDVTGTASVMRGALMLWRSDIRSGDGHMCHTLANLEHHHFKFPLHRRPGDVHVHFFGASAFSFGDKVRLSAGDVMEVAFEGYGRALRNALHAAENVVAPVAVRGV